MARGDNNVSQAQKDGPYSSQMSNNSNLGGYSSQMANNLGDSTNAGYSSQMAQTSEITSSNQLEAEIITLSWMKLALMAVLTDA